MYDVKSTNDEFVINLDNVTKWLKTLKGRIKKTLMKSYIQNIDFVVKNIKIPGKVGKPSEIILLTPRCFKLLSMQSHTKKATEVREYYYALEELVDKYKEYIIAGLNEKIERLENNQKPKVNPQKGVIYIIYASDDHTLYKIGQTLNLRERLEKYNGDKKDDIKPLYIFETDNIKADAKISHKSQFVQHP